MFNYSVLANYKQSTEHGKAINAEKRVIVSKSKHTMRLFFFQKPIVQLKIDILLPKSNIFTMAEAGSMFMQSKHCGMDSQNYSLETHRENREKKAIKGTFAIGRKMSGL